MARGLQSGQAHKTQDPTELIFRYLSRTDVSERGRRLRVNMWVMLWRPNTFCSSLGRAEDERGAAVETCSGLIHWPTQWDNNRYSTWALAWVSSRISQCSFKKSGGGTNTTMNGANSQSARRARRGSRWLRLSLCFSTGQSLLAQPFKPTEEWR